MGVIGYADDLILLAPSRRAAEKMIEICETFAEENNIVFSIDKNPDKSKSKTMYVVGYGEKNLPPPDNLYLCGTALPWVNKADHLGHLLSSDSSLENDARQKLARYIDSSVKMRENFFFAHPLDQIDAIEKYCSTVYGSSLMDLSGVTAKSIFSAWKTGVKLCWGISRGCHTYLLQNVLAPHSVSLRVRLLTQSWGFFHGLLSSPSREVSVAARISARDKSRVKLGTYSKGNKS